MQRHLEEGGFTLVEIVIVLAIVLILAGVVGLNMGRHIKESRVRRAQQDVQSICAAIIKFNSDTGLWPVSTNFNASGSGTASRNDVDTLKGPGKEPVDNSSSRWLSLGRSVDDMADHLFTNAADYPITGTRAWNGPYLDRLDEDPWGHAYLVNVRFLQPDQIRNMKSVFVLSAGPDGEIDTPFEGSGTQVVTPQDDDIVYRLK